MYVLNSYWSMGYGGFEGLCQVKVDSQYTELRECIVNECS